MDLAIRSPLLDFFRRGEVVRDVRLLAAQGALAPRAHEQLALLMLLTEDPDPDIAATAEATLQKIPTERLRAFLARADVPEEMRTFFRSRGLEPAETPAPHADDPLISVEHEGGGEGEKKSVMQRLAALTVAERMKVAMLGSREERTLLVRDPNKLVSAAVMSSPKLTESEVESFAKMANVSDDVLRAIGKSRHWVKSYPIASALVRNPKTPVAISLTLISRLVERDVKAIAVDRNVPEPLRLAARKMMTTQETRRG
jgi:hypothetical protein